MNKPTTVPVPAGFHTQQQEELVITILGVILGLGTIKRDGTISIHPGKEVEWTALQNHLYSERSSLQILETFLHNLLWVNGKRRLMEGRAENGRTAFEPVAQHKKTWKETCQVPIGVPVTMIAQHPAKAIELKQETAHLIRTWALKLYRVPDEEDELRKQFTRLGRRPKGGQALEQWIKAQRRIEEEEAWLSAFERDVNPESVTSLIFLCLLKAKKKERGHMMRQLMRSEGLEEVPKVFQALFPHQQEEVAKAAK